MNDIVKTGNFSCRISIAMQLISIEAKTFTMIFNDFTDTMTVGSYKEQIARTLLVKDENLIYYGIVLIGDRDKVTELTKKFSLWR